MPAAVRLRGKSYFALGGLLLASGCVCARDAVMQSGAALWPLVVIVATFASVYLWPFAATVHIATDDVSGPQVKRDTHVLGPLTAIEISGPTYGVLGEQRGIVGVIHQWFTSDLPVSVTVHYWKHDHPGVAFVGWCSQQDVTDVITALERSLAPVQIGLARVGPMRRTTHDGYRDHGDELVPAPVASVWSPAAMGRYAFTASASGLVIGGGAHLGNATNLTGAKIGVAIAVTTFAINQLRRALQARVLVVDHAPD